MSSILSLPGKVWDSAADLWTKTEQGLRKQLTPQAPPEAPATPDLPVQTPAQALVANPVPVMPIPDEKAAIMARRRSIASTLATRGRASTILTSEGTLGSPPQALGGS